MDTDEHLRHRGSSTDSEGIGKHPKSRKEESVETKNICDVKGCSDSRAEETLKN